MTSTRLDPTAIADTARRLDARVADRFPERGVHGLASDLVGLADGAPARLARVTRPRWRVRWIVVSVVVAAVVLVVVAAPTVSGRTSVDGLDEWLDVVESALQDLVFVGAAGIFLFGIEGRLRRREALADLHELRSLAHVIDMHQLTKDPEALAAAYRPTESSPDRGMGPAEMARYLDYCSEMLSLTGKLAALYSQDTRDPVVLGTVREIQELTTALSSKVWQKLSILDRATPKHISPPNSELGDQPVA